MWHRSRVPNKLFRLRHQFPIARGAEVSHSAPLCTSIHRSQQDCGRFSLMWPACVDLEVKVFCVSDRSIDSPMANTSHPNPAANDGTLSVLTLTTTDRFATTHQVSVRSWWALASKRPPPRPQRAVEGAVTPPKRGERGGAEPRNGAVRRL
jgi:hypothetical protein